MNEGASACAGGIAGACDKIYLPSYTWPGIVLMTLSLVVLLVLARKHILKIRFKVVMITWLALAVCFTAVVLIQVETGGSRSGKAHEFCRLSGAPNCEY